MGEGVGEHLDGLLPRSEVNSDFENDQNCDCYGAECEGEC